MLKKGIFFDKKYGRINNMMTYANFLIVISDFLIVITLLKSIFLILEIREEKIKARDGCAEKRLKKNNKLENIKANY
jgi:hypothetical protein